MQNTKSGVRRYTKRLHTERLRLLQGLLDEFIKFADSHDLNPGADILRSDIPSTFIPFLGKFGGVFEICHTTLSEGSSVSFFRLHWGTRDNNDYLILQFDRRNMVIRDSTVWDGSNRVGGHIQCSHNFRHNEKVFVDMVIAVLNSPECNWQLINYLQSDIGGW